MASGGEFWSNNACRASGGYMLDAVQVPGNMGFDEQVKFAEGARGKQAAVAAAEDNELARQFSCHGPYAAKRLVQLLRRAEPWSLNQLCATRSQGIASRASKAKKWRNCNGEGAVSPATNCSRGGMSRASGRGSRWH